MQLKTVMLPTEILEIAQSTVAAMCSSNFITKLSDTDAVVGASVAGAHPLYLMPISSEFTQESLFSLHIAAWRYLILNGDTPIGIVDVPVDPNDSKSPRKATTPIAQVSTGRYAKRFSNAIEYIEAQEGDSYPTDVSVIEIPAVHVALLWLHTSEDNAFLSLNEVIDHTKILNFEAVSEKIDGLKAVLASSSSYLPLPI